MRGLHTVLLSTLLLLATLPALAQEDRTRTPNREGLWVNLGVGWGSLGCDTCGSREPGRSGLIAVGGTLSNKVLIGGGWNAWLKSKDGATLSVSTLTAMIRYYPVATGGFFLTGGAGAGRQVLDLEVGDLGFPNTITFRDWGVGAMFGLGYDFHVGKTISITPFWSGFAVNVGQDLERDSNNTTVGQLGVGMTVQ